jgi:phage tail protein X
MATEPYEEVRSLEGDTVDLIVFRRFGEIAGQVERTLEANLYLADLGPILPLGTIVRLPLPAVQARETVGRLWD